MNEWLWFAVVLCCAVVINGQSPIVGRSCSESTECNIGGFCNSNKRCACLTSYISINGYCWRRITPGQAGCSMNRQCDVVWPGAYCSSGTCKCGNNQPPFPTMDGLVCVNYGECPLGERSVKLREAQGLHVCSLLYTSPGGAAAGGQVPYVPSHTRPYDCPETYDCIFSTSTGLVGGTTGTPSSSFCCPAKAYTCIQPSDQGTFPGNGGSSVTRYYHDPITHTCKQFDYYGADGNSNRFETLEHCQSYCMMTCERGRPEYSIRGVSSNRGDSILALPGTLTCDTTSSSGDCRTGFACTSVGTINVCCPNIDSVCSLSGGVAYAAALADQTAPTTSTPYDAGLRPTSTSETKSRWYYDKADSNCKSFTYLGQAGNFNNFITQSHCDAYCSKIACDAGVPMKDQTGLQVYDCSGSDSKCPTSHQCKSNRCCPRPQFVCKLPIEAGNCAEYSQRWWFNIKTGSCEQFLFSGCQGNDNNFASYTNCQTFCQDVSIEPVCVQGKAHKDGNQKYTVCGGASATTTACPTNHYCYYDGNTYGCCPNQAYTCSLTSSTGRECGPAVTRWYYSSTSKKCATFSYKGCDGNSNNFATQQDCNEYCRIDNCPDGGSPYMESNGNSRSCSADGECPGTHYCTPISTFSGSLLTTRNYCCPSKNYVCSLQRDTGVRCSSSLIPRYYFNSATRSCEIFQYNGCGGNRNSFATKKACENYCYSSSCDTGDIIAIDATTSRISTCTSVGASGTVSNGCADGYQCNNSPLLNQNVCCGAPSGTQGMCPAQSKTYINPLTLQPRQCTPNVAGSCPGGYFCWYSSLTGQNSYVCCKEAVALDAGLCPPQLKPVKGSSGAAYKFCSPGAPNSARNACGENEYCQYAESTGQFICCGSGSDVKPNVCPPEPAGLSPYYVGRDYRNCDPNAIARTNAACPTDSACLFINDAIQFICCRNPSGKKIAKQDRTKPRTPDQRQTEAKDSYNSTDISISASHCGGQRGYKPVDLDSSCSPMDGNSCFKYKHLGSEVSCMESKIAKRFVCCYSLFR